MLEEIPEISLKFFAIGVLNPNLQTQSTKAPAREDYLEAEWPRLGLPRNAQILAARSQDLDVLGSKEKHTMSFCCEWVALTKQSV